MQKVTADEFVRVFPVFRKDPDDLVERILSSSVQKQFSKDDVFYSDGDACPGIGLFLSGEVRVFKTGESGREITLYDVFPGETCILNASCILSQKGYPANAVAMQDGEVLFVPAKVFQHLVTGFDAMRQFIFSLFNQRFVEVMELLEEVAFGKMDRRLSDYLVEKSGDGVLNSTHQQIANELGTSREVVSRLLKDLERRGAIRLSRNMIQLKSL